MDPLGLRRSWRHLNRYQEIIKVFVKYGFWNIVEKIRSGLLFDISKKILPRLGKEELAVLGTAVRLRMALEELGPTFIKLGQMLSVRPDLIPPDVAEEFTKLQDDVAPVEFAVIKPYMETEYGASLMTIFDEFDGRAIASASLAQVYHAKLKSGEDVAVKVMRPNIQNVIDTDLEILYDLANLLEKHVPESELYDPVGIVNEFAKDIRKEQNLYLEGRHIDIFHRYLKEDPTIKVPIVFWDYTNEKILVMEFIHGVKISNFKKMEELGIDRKEVAYNGARVLLKQIFEFGFFHGDPHPGNIFVLPENVIAPVDFGMMGRIDDEMKEDLLNILRGIVEKDAYHITKALLNVGMLEERVNFRELQRDLLDYLDRYYGVPLNKLNASTLLNEFMELIRNYRINLPPDLILMAKALSIYEGVGRMLYPEFNMFDLVIPYVKKSYYQHLNPAYQYKHISRILDAGFSLVKNLPDDIQNILFKLRKDRVTIRFQHQGLENLTKELDRSSNRLAFALIISALIIGSSFIIQLNKGPLVWGYPVLGVLGFLLASFLGLWLVVAILRSGKL